MLFLCLFARNFFTTNALMACWKRYIDFFGYLQLLIYSSSLVGCSFDDIIFNNSDTLSILVKIINRSLISCNNLVINPFYPKIVKILHDIEKYEFFRRKALMIYALQLMQKQFIFSWPFIDIQLNSSTMLHAFNYRWHHG